MRVAVQQRHRFYRDGLSELLGAEPDLLVVGTVETPAELLAVCDGEGADVAVLEWDKGEPPPHRTTQDLRTRLPALHLVVLSGRESIPDGAMSHSLAAVVVRRSDGLASIVEAIRSPRLAQARVHGAPKHENAGYGAHATPAGEKSLTARERTILALIGAGHTSHEIAGRLRISRKTVDNHKQRMFAKLAVQNQAHAVAVAIRRGMLIPEPFVAVVPAS